MTGLDVQLEASEPLPADLLDRLRDHLDDAVADLGLPGPARVRTAVDAVPGDAVRVTVGDARFVLGAAPGWYVVAGALHAHRAAWITGPVAEELRAEIAPGAEPELFRAAARELARRGVAVRHLTAPGDRADGTTVAEAAMATRTARVDVRVAPADVEVTPVEPEILLGLAEELWTRLGLVLPAVALRPDAGLPPGTAEAVVNDVRLPAVDSQWYFGLESVVTDVVRAAASDHAGSLVTAQVVDFLLDRLAESFPNVVRAARQRWSVERLTSALRVLLDEGVPTTDLRAVLEACLEGARGDGDDPLSGTRPRIGLAMVRPLLDGGVLHVHRLGDGRAGGESALSEHTVAALHDDLGVAGVMAGDVLLAEGGLAPNVRAAVRPRFPYVRVLSVDDVPLGIDVEARGAVLLR
jgi:hypothetical protein